MYANTHPTMFSTYSNDSASGYNLEPTKTSFRSTCQSKFKDCLSNLKSRLHSTTIKSIPVKRKHRSGMHRYYCALETERSQRSSTKPKSTSHGYSTKNHPSTLESQSYEQSEVKESHHSSVRDKASAWMSRKDGWETL